MRGDLKSAPQHTDPGTSTPTNADAVQRPSPSEDAVRAELASILKSEAFAGAPRQQRLLRHLVEKQLAGAAGDLKEYTLGVEVFDRGDEFDSRLDPIVRVEASRLRSRLQKYYEGRGVDDSVRISLPRGAYVPSFTLKEEPLPETEHPAPPTEETVAAVALAPEPLSGASLDLARGESVEPHIPLVGKLGLGFSALVLVTVIFLTVGRSAPPASAPDFLKFRRLTSDVVACTTPTFSPDGKTVAYARHDTGHWQLYSRQTASLEARLLTPNSTDDNTQPAWAPKGDRIVFRSERDGGGLFLLDTDTLQVSRLTSYGYHPAWSPDGKTIAFSTGTFREPGETSFSGSSVLDLLDVSTGKVSRLGAPDQIRDAVQPAWSPNGKRIAYWSGDNGELDIWTVALPDTPGAAVTPPVCLTRDTWTDWSPVWAPDGRYLYFSSDRGGAMNLWRVRIDEQTGNALAPVEPVTTPSSYSGWMSFSPGGKQFAYVHRLVSSQLFRAPFTPEHGIDIDKRQQLTAGERIVREPEASPDGKWIVVRLQDPQEDLALIRPDGTDFHRITNDRFADRSPHWSPDGREIVFMSNRSDNVLYQLWRIRPDGSGLKQLTERGAVSYAWLPDGTLVGYPSNGKPYALEHPGASIPDMNLPPVFRPMAWSPDAKSVVGRMHASGFGPGALFVFTPGSSDFWQISRDSPYTSVSWLPGSDRVLFSRNDGICLADIAKHTVTPEPANLPGQLHSRFTASSDGTTVYFVVSDDEEDIWLASQ